MTTSFELATPNVMLTVIGVLGFTISYRAASALIPLMVRYELYWLGRTAWSDLMKTPHAIIRLIWYQVPPCRTPCTSGKRAIAEWKRPGQKLSEVIAEKKMALDLGEGFSVALKHHSRVYYEDLYDLVCLQPQSLSPNYPDLLASKTPPRHLSPLEVAERVTSYNLPLEILRCLSEWCNLLEDRGTVPGTSLGSIMGCISTFEDKSTDFILISDFSPVSNGKISIVPLPLICVQRSHWLFLFFLPLQLVAMFGWHSITEVLIASSIYLGFLAAGEEIEQPFGYDEVYFPAKCTVVCD
ncbi:uncharacterized protein C8R40DRAFT_1067051 [Lentinula edodes]|uniref:uncharacterized protein n=1 Tax=Lentinula edodes TaxID=5353 RepID=UPI001E8DA66D|nr:uncharacterized protein C8R40DRAFT_1067051 [Lentinula edodes]KAH7878634.1 hypothetical protein C8R40DRAFT_1067051 [Lentinula edodes]